MSELSTITADEATPWLGALARMGLLAPGETPVITPLTGGVSSAIVRVDLRAGPICLKRALPKLKVVADWQVPVARNRYEQAWLRVMGRLVPEAVPRVLGDDASSGTFAMDYFPASEYPVWKALLRDGQGPPSMARQVGQVLGRLHAATARLPALAQEFATDALFEALRLQPYLQHSALQVPECAMPLQALITQTRQHRLALVHGDVSPKNLLAGPRGPVFLDAECAWWGDPAFDLAFCLNHLLLKCLWRPQWRSRYLADFAALRSAYLAEVTWEAPTTLESRAARLLPGLLLARVAGKSPVEYLTAPWQTALVRQFASHHLHAPPATLLTLATSWSTLPLPPPPSP